MSWFVKGGQRRGLGVPQEGNIGFVMNPWGVCACVAVPWVGRPG